MSDTMTGKQLDNALGRLDGWSAGDDGRWIEKTFEFKDFRAAMAFMNTVADEAERLDHHPDWSNSYDTVEVTLSTHDAGGVTQKDLDLAAAMDKAAG